MISQKTLSWCIGVWKADIFSVSLKDISLDWRFRAKAHQKHNKFNEYAFIPPWNAPDKCPLQMFHVVFNFDLESLNKKTQSKNEALMSLFLYPGNSFSSWDNKRFLNHVE